MAPVCDIYLPLDERESANQEVWPVAVPQLRQLEGVVRECGWEPNVLNPEKPVSHVCEGLEVIKKAKGERFLNFMAGWCYPDFSVSPMHQLDRAVPKLMLGSAIPDFPGAVGLFAAQSGLAQVGIETSRLFVWDFADHASYAPALKTFLDQGRYEHPMKPAIDVPVTDEDRARARAAVAALRGSVYGAVGPRSMQMWNKISDADFLSVFGIAREGFDGLRLAHMAERVDDARAERAVRFLVDHGMDLRLGQDPATSLTRDQVLFQMKVYCALLDLKQRYGLTFMGVQDQLDWIEHYPATDLALGLLNNRLRPEGDGETFVVATEADDGAALTMQTLKLLNGGDPAGFNDLRYWDPELGVYWFVNSGALAPFFAQGSHESLEGAWSERQTPMYFGQGGGTSSVVVRKPGVTTWARFSYRDHGLTLCAGRGLTDVVSEEEWLRRSERCSRDWPHWYLKLCGEVEWKIDSNHPMTAFGDHLGALKAVAEELGLPFRCWDHTTPEEMAAGG